MIIRTNQPIKAGQQEQQTSPHRIKLLTSNLHKHKAHFPTPSPESPPPPQEKKKRDTLKAILNSSYRRCSRTVGQLGDLWQGRSIPDV